MPVADADEHPQRQRGSTHIERGCTYLIRLTAVERV